MTIRTIDTKRENIRRVEWALKGRVVLGGVNNVVGEEGSGKTTAVSYFVAGWTKGRLDGDLKGHPCNVRIVGAEDDYNKTWVPKLYGTDANLDRVKLWERDDLRSLDIREDIDEMEKKCVRERVKIVVFDAFVDNLAGDTDSNHQRQVRRDMTPLRILAGKLNIAVLVCLHTNKRGTTFRQIMQGSTAFNQVSRSSLWVTRFPEGEENERVILVGKSNYAVTGNPMEFKILPVEIDTDDGPMEVSRALFNGKQSEVQMDEVIASLSERAPAKKAGLDKLVKDLLSEGPRLAREVTDECMSQGYGYRSVLRARDRLGIEVQRTKTVPPEVWWHWVEDDRGVDSAFTLRAHT
jgi:hypothetical protein